DRNPFLCPRRSLPLTLPLRGPLPLPTKAGRGVSSRFLPRPACGERGGVRGNHAGWLGHRSQPEDGLGDDVLLDLVGATVDRDLAGVEIGGRDRAGPFGADRRLVPALL